MSQPFMLTKSVQKIELDLYTGQKLTQGSKLRPIRYHSKITVNSPLFQPNSQRDNKLGNLSWVHAFFSYLSSLLLPGYKVNQDGSLFTQSFLWLTSGLLGVPLSQIASGCQKIVLDIAFMKVLYWNEDKFWYFDAQILHKLLFSAQIWLLKLLELIYWRLPRCHCRHHHLPEVPLHTAWHGQPIKFFTWVNLVIRVTRRIWNGAFFGITKHFTAEHFIIYRISSVTIACDWLASQLNMFGHM